MTMTATMPAVISSSDPKPEEVFAPKPIAVVDDWTKNPDRWLGTKGHLPKPLSNECLAALREATSDRGGKQLPDAMRQAIIEKYK